MEPLKLNAGIRISNAILVLVGPTASGKTAIAMELAKLLDGEIISADSRQVYKFLDIGTAKPSLEQRTEIKHYFVDELLPDREFNAGEFGGLGRRIITEMFDRGKTPIVSGGSGLYLQSLIDGFFDGPGADKDYREMLEKKMSDGGFDSMLEELKQIDPASAERIDSTKPRRVIRALEVHHTTGKPLSEFHAAPKQSFGFTPVFFGLEWERNELYKRIEHRCEEMIEAGLLNEVKNLAARGYTSEINALNTVGYVEGFAYLRGEIALDEMIRRFKQQSRRYAKRQMTWFRRDKRIHWVAMNDRSEAAEVAHRIGQMFINQNKP